jgi:hypothetical protein
MGNQLSIFPLECTALFVSDAGKCYVRYWDGIGEQWVFGGDPSMKLATMREVGKEAANLESSFSWDDAATVNECIRRYWPEVCNCHACQQREKLAQVQETFEKVKLSPIEKFFQWLYGVKHG